MLFYAEVVIPGPWWNTLTYILESSTPPQRGVRVRVPVGSGSRVGFVESVADSPPVSGSGTRMALKTVREVLDERCVLGDDLWGLAGWTGKTFLCGMGEALQLICPKALLRGGPFSPPPPEAPANGVFRERACYDPRDEERRAGYVEELSRGGRALVLFPEKENASLFFRALPSEIREESLLWPESDGGKKIGAAWDAVCRGEVRVIVGTGRAVFAPMTFETIIVDDEANPSYVFVRAPRVSARTLAGRRALSLKAVFLLGGRLPSARTYLRSRPACSILPRRENLVFVDMGRARKNAVPGVEGELFLTKSLLDRTRATLAAGRSVFWIMDRKGLSGEVFCSDCGSALSCSRCGSTMRSESEGAVLRCVQCGMRDVLPPRCPVCRGTLLRGRRPGLEALLPTALRYVENAPVLMDEPSLKRVSSPALLLGTRRLLTRCDLLDVGLVGWLDLDAEERKTDYNARFQTFSMIWESCWRGLKGADAWRVVLMQTRRTGNAWRSALWSGWENFWRGDLEERKNLNLPPYATLVQIDLPDGENRDAFAKTLEDAGFSVMDAGDGISPLRVTVNSIGKLRKALRPRFEIRHSRRGFPVLTLCAE